MSKIMYKDKQILGCISDSKYAFYDNTGTGLSATNAQDAITELNGKLKLNLQTNVETKIGTLDGKDLFKKIIYYNTTIPTGGNVIIASAITINNSDIVKFSLAATCDEAIRPYFDATGYGAQFTVDSQGVRVIATKQTVYNLYLNIEYTKK